MQIVLLKSNGWGNPTLQDWVPIAHHGSMKGMAVQLGRQDEKKEYPLELWLDIRPEGPKVTWSWFRNWGRPFIEEAEPQDFGTVSDVLALVSKSHEKFAADGILLLVDLHVGKKPHQNLQENFHGKFVPQTKDASRVFQLSQQVNYPLGMLVVYPGYQAIVQAEGAWSTYTLTYPSAERGVFLIPHSPIITGPTVMGHYHHYGVGAWPTVVSPFEGTSE